jgi:hypothetical protein
LLEQDRSSVVNKTREQNLPANNVVRPLFGERATGSSRTKLVFEY